MTALPQKRNNFFFLIWHRVANRQTDKKAIAIKRIQKYFG